MLAAIDKQVHIPPESYTILWDHAINVACRTFVEGYAVTMAIVATSLLASCTGLLRPRNVATRGGHSCSWTFSSLELNWKSCQEYGLLGIIMTSYYIILQAITSSHVCGRLH